MAAHRPQRLISTAALAVLVLGAAQRGYGQAAASPAGDPNASVADTVVTVTFQGYSISGLVTHLQDANAFKYGVALFPGRPGIMKLHEEDGQPRYAMAGNFVIRSREHWLDEETLAVVVDAPSDQWGTFYQQWRAASRYGADVAALINEIARRYGAEDWTFVGTSEGSVSAFHAARMNPGLARRLILSSSLWGPTRDGPGLSWVSWGDLSARILWVHHESDACPYTPYREAQRYAEKTHSPLLTVRGGSPVRGEPCGAFAAHGYVGMERETVLAMHSWVKTGVAPADVGALGR